MRLWQDKTAEAWARKLQQPPDSGPLCAVALFNRGSSARNVTIAWKELEVLGSEWRGMAQGSVRDLWEQRAVGFVEDHLTLLVEPHAVRLLRVADIGIDL